MSATRACNRSSMPSLRASRFRESMNGGWVSIATICARDDAASTSVWAPVPQPMSRTRVRGPTSGTSPRARRVPAGVPGPCLGNPQNSSKNSAVTRSGAIPPVVACPMPAAATVKLSTTNFGTTVLYTTFRDTTLSRSSGSQLSHWSIATGTPCPLEATALPTKQLEVSSEIGFYTLNCRVARAVPHACSRFLGAQCTTHQPIPLCATCTQLQPSTISKCNSDAHHPL